MSINVAQAVAAGAGPVVSPLLTAPLLPTLVRLSLPNMLAMVA